jgi:hypothetical protein
MSDVNELDPTKIIGEGIVEQRFLLEENSRMFKQIMDLQAELARTKLILNEGVEIIEGLAAFFPEIMDLSKVKMFIKQAAPPASNKQSDCGGSDITGDATPNT